MGAAFVGVWELGCSTDSNVSQAVVRSPERTAKLVLTKGSKVSFVHEAKFEELAEANSKVAAPKNFIGRAVTARSVCPATRKLRLETGIWKLLMESSSDSLESPLLDAWVQ
jgi:hypothetical protein